MLISSIPKAGLLIAKIRPRKSEKADRRMYSKMVNSKQLKRISMTFCYPVWVAGAEPKKEKLLKKLEACFARSISKPYNLPVDITEKTTRKVLSFGVIFTVMAPLKSVGQKNTIELMSLR